MVQRVLRFDTGIFSFPRVKAGSLLELAADGQRPAVHQDEIHVRPLEDPSHQAEEGVDLVHYCCSLSIIYRWSPFLKL